MAVDESGEALRPSAYPAVALLSAAVLVLQIALNRVFSFTTWHHLAYISVSLALLGFGASGSVLAAFPSLRSATPARAIGLYSALSGVSTLLVVTILGGVPLDLGETTRGLGGAATLVLYFTSVSTPFFFAGLAIAVALRAAGPAAGRLYAWDLVGAGLGCLLSVVLMNAFGAPRTVLATGLMFAVAGAIASGAVERRASLANLAAGVLALIAFGPLPSSLPFAPSSDKFIAPFLEGSKTYVSHWSALFRTDLIGQSDGESREGGYRVNGASSTFEGERPPYRLIFHDGAAAALMYRVDSERMESFDWFRHHVLTSPYLLLDEPEVLVIGVGGGADIINALANDASHVTGIELDPFTVELISEQFRDWTGGIFDRPDVSLVQSEGRHFMRSGEQRYDLVQLTGVDTLAALSSGAYILAENYLYTREAVGEYLDRLRPDGVLSIAAVDHHPSRGLSRHALRFVSLAVSALEARGIEHPSDHVAVISEPQGVALFEVLTKLEPFTDAEVQRLAQFAEAEGFETWYLPRQPMRQLAPFQRVLGDSPQTREAFFDFTFLDLRAPSDDRPFFFSFYKWRHLFEHRDEIDPGHLMATGQIVLVLILGLAIAFSVVAIVLPLWRAGGAGDVPARWGFLGYFAALGAGFIFAEISFVQRFLLFLGYPTYSLTVILFAFLSAAGVGSWWSQRLSDDAGRVLPRLAVVLSALIVVYWVALPPLFEALLGTPIAVRAAVTVALCAPLGAVLGVFFPYGIRLTSTLSRDFTAWAWAVNGCLTVVGSVATIMLATAWGFTLVLALLLAIYWAGVAAFIRSWRRVRAA
jgi:spermidine synthase